MWSNRGQITHFHKPFHLALCPLQVTQPTSLLAPLSETILTDLLWKSSRKQKRSSPLKVELPFFSAAGEMFIQQNAPNYQNIQTHFQTFSV